MIDRQILLKRIVISAIIMMLAGLLYFIYSHGFLVHENHTENTSIDYVKYSSGLSQSPASSAESSTFVNSGLYSVASVDPEGTFIQTISVPTFLRSASLSKNNSYPLVETIARNSLTHLFMSPSGIISSNLDNTVRIPNQSVTTNSNFTSSSIADFPLYTDSIQIDPTTVCGILGTGNVQPSCFNIVSRESVYFSALSSKNTRLERNSQRFAVFDTDSKTSYLYDPKSKETNAVKLPSSTDLSLKEGDPLVSRSRNSVAFVNGRDINGSNDNDAKPEGGSQTLTILNAKTKQQITKKVFGSTLITGVSLSIEGTTIAITTPAQTGFYNVKDLSDPYFVIPYVADSFQWIDERRVIAKTDNNGVLDISIKKRTARSVIPYSTVRPTQLSFYADGALYFTGYASSIKGRTEPSAYRSVIDTPRTTSSKNAIAKFPHQGNGFYIDVIGGSILIQTTRYIDGLSSQIDTTGQKNALKYIQSHMKDSDEYDIKYTYVDFDLTQTAEDQLDD